MAEDKADEARVIEGRIAEIDNALKAALEEEERVRDSFKAEPKQQPKTFAEAILGPRDQFHGLEIGFRNEGDEPASEPNPVVHVGAPQEWDIELPRLNESLYGGFASTLPRANAIGTVNYKQRGTATGAPASWAGVDADTDESAAKAKVLYTWVDAVANKETFAGYVPVSKDTLLDYDELQSIIASDLQIQLREVVDGACVNGSNSAGVVGIKNTTGIQTYTATQGDSYYDSIRKMKTAVMTNARRVPTHVAVSPAVKEAIDLYKTTDKFYQSLLSGDTIWGMQIVEDENIGGILVYDASSARIRTIHNMAVEVGYVNDQFIKNELCILAEQTVALQVVRPNAFCYMAV